MTAIRGYVPGAQIVKAEIDSDDTWGRTYRCDYFRGRHKGSIKVSERGHLMDLSQEVDPGENAANGCAGCRSRIAPRLDPPGLPG